MNQAHLDLPALMSFVEAEFRHQFRNVVDQIAQPIARRVDRFTCWPGLVVEESRDEGKSLTLSFRRNPSKLRVGEHVYVNDLQATPEEIISGPEGVITAIDAAARRIELNAGYQQGHRFQRRFRLGQKLVLDQTLPGARHGRDMPILALRFLGGEFGSAPRLERIRELLEGAPIRTFEDAPRDESGDPALERLTPAQAQAVASAMSSELTLVQGPPGTGKTHVLGLIIRGLVRRGLKVGVCAFTHQAINNVLIECLKHEEIAQVCKLGAASSWSGPPAEARLKLAHRPAAFFRQKTTPCVTGFTQHAAFNPVARGLDAGAAEALPDRFDVLVFDEAGQLTLPAAAMAMIQADRWVFAGDHAQLPPVVQTQRPGFGSAVSVFQHLAERAGHASVLLDQSFRLNDELAAFPSEEFYDGKVVAAPSAAKRRLALTTPPPAELRQLLDPEQPSTLALVRHEGRGQESPEEAALVAGLVDAALRSGVPQEEIAVISPHRRQNVAIREFCARLGHAGGALLIDTVERIQGQERDFVIISMALSDADAISAEADFLFLPNRLNVALTRARKKLVFVASPSLFRALPPRWAFAAPGASPLEPLNVLKRWYFRHKRHAIDASEIAGDLLTRINGTGAVAATDRAPKGVPQDDAEGEVARGQD